MRILAIDASSECPAVGLSAEYGTTWTAEPVATRRHGRDLIPAIRDLLREASMRVSELGVIGVGLGPGSYTGLRIGLTAAKLLAYSSGAVLVGFDSLEAAACAGPPDALHLVAVADAQRGDVYTSAFQRRMPGEPLVAVVPSRIEPLESWRASLDSSAVIVGPGLASLRIRDSIPDGIATVDRGRDAPGSGHLIALVRRKWAEGRRDDLWTLEPNYLRRSAAEDQWDAQGRT